MTVDSFFDFRVDQGHVVVLFGHFDPAEVLCIEGVWDSHAFRVGAHDDVLDLHEVVWDFFEQAEAEIAEEVREVVEQDQQES